MFSWRKLLLSIGLCLVVGAVASVFTVDSIPTWYASLTKPDFSPPNWIFGPVWTALYIMMGTSFYIVWNKLKKKSSREPLHIFGIQLALNFLWTFTFFALKSPIAALITIVVLWFSILLTIVELHKFSKAAAYLMIPYIVWVSFAAILNLQIWLLNG